MPSNESFRAAHTCYTFIWYELRPLTEAPRMAPPTQFPDSPSDEPLSGFSEEFAGAFDLAPDGIVVTHASSGRIVFANPSFVELAGRSVEELQDMQIWELHPKDLGCQPGTVFKEVVSKGASGSSTQPLLRPDGVLCPIDFRAWKATWQGQPVTISIARDIARREKLQRESELRAEHSQALLRLVRDLEQAENIGMVMDAVHERVVEFLGYNHSTLCRYPANETHCTRLAIRSPNPILSSLADGVSFLIAGDELMEEIVGGAETQIVPVARLDPRIDQASVEAIGLQSIIRVVAGLSTGTRIVLEFVSIREEGVRVPSDIHLEFARGLIAHAGAVVERLELGRTATRGNSAIAGLLDAVGSHTGQEFFDALASNLGNALGVRHVLIAEPSPADGDLIRSVSFVADGVLAEPFEYPVKGTPCESVLRDGFFCIQDDVQGAFPEDKDLVEIEARAYLGVCMKDDEGVSIGHLALMHDKPFEDVTLVGTVARLFATRAAAESKRAKNRNELERSLETQRKVNELLQISGLSIGLNEKLNRSVEIVLGGGNPSRPSGGLFLLSEDTGAIRCEASISKDGAEKHPPILEDPGCSHRLAVSTLEPQFLPRGLCLNCDNFMEEEGVIYPLRSGDKAIGTLAVFGDRHTIQLNYAKTLNSTAGAIAFLIESHRAQEALQVSEERLRQSQKLEALGGFAGGIAHDFNNLLTAVLGNAELLLSDIPEEGELYERALEIQKAGRSASQLTGQLLAFTRRQVLERKLVDVVHLVRGSMEMLRRLVPEDIAFNMDLPQGGLQIYADEGQVQQVIMNLVVNARDAMPDGGELVIGLSTHAKDADNVFAALSVGDTGMGMDDATIDRAFEPFFTTKEPGKGTGLGLAVVYGIVAQHGGWIDVVSQPGKGAEFCTYLPLSLEGGAKADIPLGQDSALSRSPRRSLVVEDEDAVRRVTCQMLEQVGHQVISASGGREALELFDCSADLDVILLDVVMPGMSGVEVFLEIRKRNPQQPILFVTGHDPTTRLRDFEGSPGVGLLRKPYTSQDLARKLDELLPESADTAPIS